MPLTVEHGLKEINAFEYEGDYRPDTRQALKEILESSYPNEVDEYLGRGWYERRSDEAVKDYRNGAQRRRFLTELGKVELCLSRTRKRFTKESMKLFAFKALTSFRISKFVQILSESSANYLMHCIISPRCCHRMPEGDSTSIGLSWHVLCLG